MTEPTAYEVQQWADSADAEEERDNAFRDWLAGAWAS